MRTLLTMLVATALPATAAAQAPAGPVVVVTVATEGVEPGATDAVAQRVTDTLAERVQEREVRRVEDAERLGAMAECEAPECLATELRAEGAALGVLVHVAPAGADDGDEPEQDAEQQQQPAPGDPEAGETEAAVPLTVGLRAIDLEGAPQGTPLEVELDGTGEQALGALDGPVSQLATMLPAPPPESSLLVAINVDEADVQLDGQSVGTSPLAPLEVEPGEHSVRVAKAGFRDFEGTVRVKAGEASRMNVDLAPDAAAQARLAEQDDDRPSATKPIWKRWYFWAAVGGAAAITVIGAAAGVAAGGGGGGGEQVGFPVPEIKE